MRFGVREEPISAISKLAEISIAFEVDRIFSVSELHRGLGGLTLSERELQTPYIKDYDEIEGPARWADRFDLSNWGLIVAESGDRWVGSAVIAYDTPGVHMLEGRGDLTVLWDLRVAPEVRGKGVGAALFRSVEGWAIARGCRELKVETQNTNVAACRFYQRQGCVLGAINRFAYPELPDEVQLIWRKDLAVSKS